MDRDQLDRELIAAEGEKLYAYDDEDGSPIKCGTTVKGTVTCCVGINATFFYPEESLFLLHNREDRAVAELTRKLPWFGALDEVRTRALVNLYFNIPRFLGWPHFTAFLNKADWANAAASLENTHPWIDEVGARGHRIARMLRTGKA